MSDLAIPAAADTRDERAAEPAATVTQLYDAHAAFVWRNLARLGVPPASLEDAVQDVFLVVHRRLAGCDVENPRGWLFGILRRVAADHRRTARRRGAHGLDAVAEPTATDPAPDERAAAAEAARLVHALLARLPEARREILVLADLEQMSAPEIAGALGIPLNTVYSRLRVARAELEAHAARAAARRGAP